MSDTCYYCDREIPADEAAYVVAEEVCCKECIGYFDDSDPPPEHAPTAPQPPATSATYAKRTAGGAMFGIGCIMMIAQMGAYLTGVVTALYMSVLYVTGGEANWVRGVLGALFSPIIAPWLPIYYFFSYGFQAGCWVALIVWGPWAVAMILAITGALMAGGGAKLMTGDAPK